MMKFLYVTELRKWLPLALVFFLTCWLLYIGIGYPFLEGSGRAQADFEAVLLFLIFGLPCLIWSVAKLTWGENKKYDLLKYQIIRWVAWGNIVGMLLFLVLASFVVITR
jgi:hypothetical protein